MTSTTLTDSTGRAGARQWFGLAVLLLPVTLMTADLGVLWLATPYLSADLGPTSGQLLWITDIYGFLTAGTLVIMGTLGDRIGRRKLLMAGSAGFIVASLLAAYAPSAELLIVARAVLGISGAAVLPSTLSLISHMFSDARQRATAIAMWVTALSVGVGLGPVIGGALLANWWWGSVFLLGLPVMVLALVTAPLLLPEYRDPKPGRLDLASVALFLLAVLPVVYGIKKLAEHGFSLEAGVAFAAGVVFGTLFVRRQGTLADPLLDLRLFSNRAFTGALLMLLVGMTALNGVEYLVPQYLQSVLGQSPLEAGLWLLPGAVGLIVGSQLTPVLARRMRPAYVVLGGMLVSLIGYGMFALGSSAPVYSLATTVIMFGVAPISVLGTALAVGSAPPEKAGSAAATGQTAYDLGLALGIAVTGSLAVAVYRGEIPASAPAQARDTLGGALASAEKLPAAAGDELLVVAREAFTSGFHVAALVSAGFALVTGVLVVALLRHIPAISGGSQEADTPREAAQGVEGAEDVEAAVAVEDGEPGAVKEAVPTS